MTKVLKCSAVVIGVYIALLTTSIASPLQIIVPAYFYPDTPTSAWDKMTALTGKGVGITAIVNPASGPNTTDNPDYDRAIKAFRAAGGKVVGYVPSGYTGSSVSADSTCRPAKGGATYVASDIVNCAKYYQQFYDLDGIFVDEFGAPASGAPLKQVIAYYQTIYNGLKAINSNWTVFGNPGTQIEEALLRRANKGGADVLITFEDKAGHFPQYRPDAYTKKYDSKHFGAILYGQRDKTKLGVYIDNAITKNIGWIYVSGDTLPNPYDTLPGYFAEEIKRVNMRNPK